MLASAALQNNPQIVYELECLKRTQHDGRQPEPWAAGRDAVKMTPWPSGACDRA